MEVISKCLGNNKYSNFEAIVEDLVQNLEELYCSSDLKLHLGYFPENIEVLNEEQDKRFYQGTKQIERWYQRHWYIKMIMHYCSKFSKKLTQRHLKGKD